jgi:hypothetical protein
MTKQTSKFFSEKQNKKKICKRKPFREQTTFLEIFVHSLNFFKLEQKKNEKDRLYLFIFGLK